MALGLAAVLVLVGVPLQATAGSSTFEGTIQAGQPGTLAGVSVSGDTLASCDPDHEVNGVDAVWSDLPELQGQHHFELTMADTLDADVFFYDEDCTWIRSVWGAQGLMGETELGRVPAEAAFAVVDGFSGTGEFEFSLEPGQIHPPAPDTFERAPIQPGGLGIAHVGPTWQHCTLNFVFEDGQGDLYIGAAGHCTGPEGTRVSSPNIGAFGTVEHRTVTSPGLPMLGEPTEGEQAMDFSLIAIDEDRYQYVDPAMRGWGGPTGVATQPETGELVHHYGHAGLYDATEPTRQRTGVFEYSIDEGAYDGWYVAAQATYGGDSGSAVLTEDGQALGTINTVAVTAGGTQAGPTVKLILEHLSDEYPELSLQTAPFEPVDETEPEDLAEDLGSLVERCAEHPVSKFQDSRSCFKYGALPQAALDVRRCAPRAPWLGTLFTGCSILSDPT